MDRSATSRDSSSSQKSIDRKPVDNLPTGHLLSVDQNNRIPLYHQLYLILRSKIHDGEYENASYIPTEHELSALYGVSRITVVRALNELAAEGLVIRERGRGTRVQFVSRSTVVRGPTLKSKSFSRQTVLRSKLAYTAGDSVRERQEAEYRILSFETVAASNDVAAALEIPAKTPVYRVDRVGYFEGEPYGYLMGHIPTDVVGKSVRSELKKHTLFEIVKRSGTNIEKTTESVTATLADAHLAKCLTVSTGSPLIKVVGIAYNARNRPLFQISAFYLPDRFQYVVSSSHGSADHRR